MYLYLLSSAFVGDKNNVKNIFDSRKKNDINATPGWFWKLGYANPEPAWNFIAVWVTFQSGFLFLISDL